MHNWANIHMIMTSNKWFFETLFKKISKKNCYFIINFTFLLKKWIRNSIWNLKCWYFLNIFIGRLVSVCFTNHYQSILFIEKKLELMNDETITQVWRNENDFINNFLFTNKIVIKLLYIHLSEIFSTIQQIFVIFFSSGKP